LAYVAVLDADVLHPHIAVDLLLRLAERRFFQPAWSEEILEEVHRSLIRRGLDPARIARRIDVMRKHFPEAMTSEVGRFMAAVPAAVDPGDHHVVAAAFAARADAIVTRNVRDFAPSELIGLGIEVQSLDAFLRNQWSLDTDALTDVLQQMEEDRTRPPKTMDELLNALRLLAPTFADAVRESVAP
jgi:predicted nucleic acid-binding protein